MRDNLQQRIDDVVHAMPEMEGAVALADWLEQGRANTEALAEALEVRPEEVVKLRQAAREKMLEAARTIVEVDDWETLRRALVPDRRKRRV
ncbi:MAG: hypothetical protein GY711_20920 [bacterium]|nr:hypothetical protein [bacterium]